MKTHEDAKEYTLKRRQLLLDHVRGATIENIRADYSTVSDDGRAFIVIDVKLPNGKPLELWVSDSYRDDLPTVDIAGIPAAEGHVPEDDDMDYGAFMVVTDDCTDDDEGIDLMAERMLALHAPMAEDDTLR